MEPLAAAAHGHHRHEHHEPEDHRQADPQPRRRNANFLPILSEVVLVQLCKKEGCFVFGWFYRLTPFRRIALVLWGGEKKNLGTTRV